MVKFWVKILCMNSIKNYLKNKYILSIVAVVVLVVILFAFKSNGQNTDSVVIKKTDFTKTVSVSGKVVAKDDVELSFETSGTVASVNNKVGDSVKRGDVIASLNSSDVLASRDKALADLDAAKAELQRLQSGNSVSSQTTIDKQQLVNSIVDAYTKSDDAVHNKVDQYFRDGTLSNPRIAYRFFGYEEKQGPINMARADVENVLSKFKLLALGLSVNTYSDSMLSDAKAYTASVKDFLDMIAPAVNSFETGASLSQTNLDKYKTDLATARFNVNLAINDMSSKESGLYDSLIDIKVYEARVSAAEAVVRGYDADLAKMSIVAPFDGVVATIDAKVGASVSAHTNQVKLISSGLQVEAYIPEISLPGLAVSNTALVSLDAYPDTSFAASVIELDPAETIRDGVSNYKVKLAFASSDERIKPGMTGDVSIDTYKRSDVLAVPERSVVSEAGDSYVFIKSDDKSKKVKVSLGARDGKGSVEVLGGVAQGDKVLLNPPEN